MVELNLDSFQEASLAWKSHDKELLENRVNSTDPQAVEVLEYVLGFSTKKNRNETARKLLTALGGIRRILECEPETLVNIVGVNKSTALLLKSLGQLNKLAHQEEFKRGRTITSPDDVASFLKEQIGSNPLESFVALFLDHRNHLLAFKTLQTGTVDHTAVYPREIIRKALDLNATGLILAHNHPAGSLEPSEGDKQLTRQVMTGCRAMGITIHDHLILTNEGSFSFRQSGLLV